MTVQPAVAFLCETIQDIEALHEKVEQAKRNIKGISFPAVHARNVQMLSPIVDASETSKEKVHSEISEAPEKDTCNVGYPKTPHPLTISSMDSHPRFVSTPIEIDSQSISIGLTPGAIRFSESETSGSIVRCRSNQITTLNKQQHVSPTEANQPPSNDSSPGLPESVDREDSRPQKGSASDYLDSTAGVCSYIDRALIINSTLSDVYKSFMSQALEAISALSTSNVRQ